ncbi:MAG TPA: hypothetical protein VEW69_11875 [Alphaproteobacteria bacterium]|nr:hypothetical protein [Alphaproteobacteria bacterium]
MINMIDDATSRWFARFVPSDSTEQNRQVLESYLKQRGRPVACYTDKASLFQTAVKTKRDQQREGQDRPEMPPTQIARALQELGIAWIAAHSPQAKGRVERGFSTAQDRLVKSMRVAGVSTLQQANQHLEQEFLPGCNETLAVAPANPDDAHRPLEKHHDLAAILSHVEKRRVMNDYTLQFESQIYQIERQGICAGLRGAAVRVEKRRDGSIAVCFRDRYLPLSRCPGRPQPAPKPAQKRPPASAPRRPGDWGKNFNLQQGPQIWQAAERSGARPEEPL